MVLSALLLGLAVWAAGPTVAHGQGTRVLLEEFRLEAPGRLVPGYDPALHPQRSHTTATSLDASRDYEVTISGTGTRCFGVYQDAQRNYSCVPAEGGPSQVDAMNCITPGGCFGAGITRVRTVSVYCPICVDDAPAHADLPALSPTNEYTFGARQLGTASGQMTFRITYLAVTGTFTVRLYELVGSRPPSTPPPPGPATPARPSGGGTPAPAPVDLGHVIYPPRGLIAGPAGATVPRRISLFSLRESRCIRTHVVATRNAVVLARVAFLTGPPGRFRLMGFRDVRVSPDKGASPCVPIPAYARRLGVKAQLRVSLGSRVVGSRSSRLRVLRIPLTASPISLPG